MKKIILLTVVLGTGILFRGNAEDNIQKGSRIANSFNYPITDRDFIMQHIQTKLDYAKFVIFDLDNIGQIKKLSESDKKKLAQVYIIVAKTGEIISIPNELTESKIYNRIHETKENFNDINEVVKNPPNSKEIVDKTIDAWVDDETRIIYDIGGYFTTIAVTKDKELIVIAVTDIYTN
ncbi:MAG TPA: hypothetical protein DD381_14555 [Lentisphaeria bacterium]|nr:MAG: hypothetical protein A2X47_01375 [Lentisphaerae bacterium GWF2_38_69]HBM17546.1 hypothetical protein [Lentisphaeria bacterium]